MIVTSLHRPHLAVLATIVALGFACGGPADTASGNASSEAALTAATTWAAWAGVSTGTYPVLAIAPSPRRDIYYANISNTASGMGMVWRAKLDDPARTFSLMPGFPLPTPAAGMPYQNVFTLTTNLNGEPIVGLSANGRSDNTDPMLMTWDEVAGHWFAPPISPSGSVCGHNLYRVSRAPNGDIWAICQWHGAYHSIDAGRSFQYIDVSALLKVTDPAYFPLRMSGTQALTDLGALYSLAFGADGTVYIGCEAGGVVYSPDRGATWHPVDYDYTNPMSTMARVTNEGNVYGLGVAADGRLVMQATPGAAAYPPADPTRFYTVDLVAHSVTIARGLPDYWMGGRMQIVTLPSGAMFFGSNHDTVNSTTGVAQIGGILSSTNAIDWSAMNAGIHESFSVSSTQWVDGNGRGDQGALAADGADLYTVTTTGKIFQLAGAGAAADAGTAGTDAGVVDGGIDAGVVAGSDAGIARVSDAGVRGGSIPHGAHGCGTFRGGSSQSGGGDQPWSLVLVAFAALARWRRPSTSRPAGDR